MRVKLAHIGVGSAFKVGAILSALAYAIFALIYFLIVILMTSAADSYTYTNMSLRLCSTYFCVIPVCGLIGGIGAAINAVLYNLVADRIGGLEVDLERH